MTSSGDKAVVPVEVKAVVPTSGGCAVFLGDDEKVFVIHVDPVVGAAIAGALGGVPAIRPQTHDLIGALLLAFGGKVERVVVNDFKNDVFYARLILSEENEVQERKVVELDARPSDAIAVALRQKAPLFVVQSVWDGAEDVTELLEKLADQGLVPRPEDGENEIGGLDAE
ncbi:bifunctional nuclease family protein [Sulfuriroseicoccus oceanibius]|uniref:Bifunctional nuclease family protein n=1 Tax=Sulfuriroseicoccus oceanibius TaxID=2707525 RepID=A0A6B3LBX7_9BACT|nr:bifunctional nuclease family protein [Sulfuriroseicoccus oceanibius]QQL45296.1 bifunctional nuclease family protein [Sulfuriroseicoccus oceanibius]